MTQALPPHIRAQLAQGVKLHGAGQLSQAQALYASILKQQPRNFDALHFLGVIALQTGDPQEAVALLDKAIRIFADDAAAYSHRGLAQQALKQADAALKSFGKAIALKPDFAEAHYNRGNVLLDLPRFTEAVAGYDRAAALRAAYVEAWHNRGTALQELGKRAAAIASYDRAVAINANLVEALFSRANAYQELKQLRPAIADYDRTLALLPDFAPAHRNRGDALLKLDRLDEAVKSYDRALELEPASVQARIGRGKAHVELGEADAALADFTAVLALEPENVMAKKGVFGIHLGQSQVVTALQNMSGKILALKTKKEGEDLGAKHLMSDFRVLHDLQQTEYLLAAGYAAPALREAHQRLQDIYARAQDSTSSRAIAVADAEIADINRFRAQAVLYEPATLGARLNPDNDWHAIEEQYFSGKPEIMYIDNLLAPEALEELRKFCLLSTVWKTDYINQYIGAFADEGFFTPLHLQIAHELQQKMPRVFGPHKLEYAWGYKYTSTMDAGIGAHADFARVNLNI